MFVDSMLRPWRWLLSPRGLTWLLLLTLVCAIVGRGGPETADAHGTRLTAAQLRARHAICAVFGSECPKALAVSWCESKYHVDAVNGQYLGVFQMGRREREIYGQTPGAWSHARAALRYRRAAGWAPWPICQYRSYAP